jgi:hypothetical protein
MPPVFINTDNTDKKNKIYVANAVGEGIAEAEDKMQAMVIKAFEKASEFTTNKIDNPKGYTLYFKVTKFNASGSDTSCTITGEILRYPTVAYSKAKGAGKTQVESVMTGGNWSGSATASGKGKRALLDCVEAIMESMVPKSIPVMKADMTRR